MTRKVYSRKKVAIPRLIQVQESEPTSGNEVTISHPPLQTELELQFEKPIDQNLSIVIRKGMRECTKHPLYPLSHVVSFKKLSPSHKSFFTSLSNVHIPTTLFEALSNENWRQAMNIEMEALKKNKTWELVDLFMGKRLVGCKWVYIVKYRADGTLEKYKTRLVAKGYVQTYNMDYLKTFATVAKMNTFGGDYMLFIKHLDWGGVATLLMYVDDIIVIGNDENERKTLRQYLTKEFEFKSVRKETGKLACKPTSTPIDPNHKFGEVEEDVAGSLGKGVWYNVSSKCIQVGNAKHLFTSLRGSVEECN
ncbi:hypothetical protein AAG906_023842 [Vitis piasezkii]